MPKAGPSDWIDSHIVTATEADGATVVELHGDIDLAVVEPLRDSMISGVEQGLPLLVDLSGVTLIDCACLGALVQAGQLAGRRGQALCMVAPPPVVRLTLAAAGLDAAFPMFGDRHQALRESMLEPCVPV